MTCQRRFPSWLSVCCLAMGLTAGGGVASAKDQLIRAKGGESDPLPPPATHMEAYVSPNKLYALYKPADWKASESAGDGALAITVTSPDKRSQVNLLWMRASRPVMTRFILLCRGALAQTYPGVSFSEVHVSREGNRGMATVAYPLGSGTARGRAYFEVTAAGGSMQEYAMPESQVAAQRAVAMNIMMSVSFIKPPQGGAGGPAPPIHKTLVDRRAQDGSLSIQIPEDWGFAAAKGRIIASEPGGGMGFIFNSYAGNPALPLATVVQGVIGSTYRSPALTLPVVLRGYGHRNPQVSSHTPDRATMGECYSYLRGGCDAEDLMATWTSKGGVDCAGAFKVVNTRPAVMGQWSSIVAGIWGPQKEFYRYYPLLEKVGNSFAISDQYAHQYIAAGLANLAILKQQTAAAIQSLNYAREDMQRAWEDRQARKDYVESKWDDYRRGNSYWVSDLEGGRVYHTDTWGTRDTLTGDYYEGGGYTWTNFEGQNPHWANENMREVSSYELEHGGPPRR